MIIYLSSHASKAAIVAASYFYLSSNTFVIRFPLILPSARATGGVGAWVFLGLFPAESWHLCLARSDGDPRAAVYVAQRKFVVAEYRSFLRDLSSVQTDCISSTVAAVDEEPVN